jgi:hypothetical protein
MPGVLFGDGILDCQQVLEDLPVLAVDSRDTSTEVGLPCHGSSRPMGRVGSVQCVGLSGIRILNRASDGGDRYIRWMDRCEFTAQYAKG